MEQNTSLSIITINYNNLNGLQKTIDSVLSQTFKDFEWIVIDGGSTDGSRELLEKHTEHFAFWCSETDKGIYNALNKGLQYAHGDYIQFLNSGDWLYENSTLGKVFTIIDRKDDIYYGNNIQVNEGDNLNPYTYPDELGFLFFPYNNICHQATFYRRNLFENNPYDESFSIVSDWAMNLKLLFEGRTFKHIDQFIVYYDNRGKSSEADNRHHLERTAAFEKYVPQQIKIDLAKYEKNYHFSRHRKSTRLIMDRSIAFAQWLDRFLSIKESKRNQ